jgi:hypothetical protein
MRNKYFGTVDSFEQDMDFPRIEKVGIMNEKYLQRRSELRIQSTEGITSICKAHLT